MDERRQWTRIVIHMGSQPDDWRVRSMRALDWLDDHVLEHRHYRFCQWLSDHPWWECGPVKYWAYD